MGMSFVEAGSLSLKSRTGQMGHSVANVSPSLRHFCKKSGVTRAQWRGNNSLKLVTRFGNGVVSNFVAWDLVSTKDSDFVSLQNFYKMMSFGFNKPIFFDYRQRIFIGYR